MENTESSVTCVLPGAAKRGPRHSPGRRGGRRRSAGVYDWIWHARNDIGKGTKYGHEVDTNDLQSEVEVKGDMNVATYEEKTTRPQWDVNEIFLGSQG